MGKSVEDCEKIFERFDIINLDFDRKPLHLRDKLSIAFRNVLSKSQYQKA